MMDANILLTLLFPVVKTIFRNSHFVKSYSPPKFEKPMKTQHMRLKMLMYALNIPHRISCDAYKYSTHSSLSSDESHFSKFPFGEKLQPSEICETHENPAPEVKNANECSKFTT